MTEIEELRYKKKLCEENIALLEQAIRAEKVRMKTYGLRIIDIMQEQKMLFNEEGDKV